MEKTPEEIAQEDKEIREFIFQLDWLNANEFCIKYNFPVPMFHSSKSASELADEFILLNARKYKIIVDKAKEIKRRKQNEKNINNASDTTSNNSDKL